ncbi:transposase for insertion sequence element, partial [mine drainage metagenome]
MKLIPEKKWPSVSLMVKEALENESLMSTAQDLPVKEGPGKASEMFERWHPSLYNYLSFSPSGHRRLRATNVLERLNPEFKRRTRKIGAF